LTIRTDDTPATTRLYLITPPALDPDRFARDLEEALAGGDVACLQLRLKEVDDATVRRATSVLQPIAQERGVAFIMNDRPDLAAELDCDGVHVGEEDAPYGEARRLLGPDRIVGVTCGDSRDRAIVAAEAGADYVAFGAFFPSTTKAAKHRARPELLADWSGTTDVPCVAIGGITQEKGVAFIMNDRPDLAAELDCDGVHVGEEDAPYGEARRLLGPERIVGVTCGDSRDRAIVAAEAGADYVAFGAFFPSTTKAAKHRASPEVLRDWSETTVVPCCAIGGINQENCAPLIEAGADFLAVIGAIWSYPSGPRAAVRDFNARFARYGRAYSPTAH
jgi:thiamine-phosphate pyrophosphorylase